MSVYDRKTGQEVAFENPDDLYQGITSGDYGFKKGQKITVYNPDDPYDVFEMPSDNYQKAIDMGYRFETPFQKSVREYVQENDGLVGGAKVALGEFTNSLLFGVPEIIMRNSADPLEWAKINALRDENEAAALAGNIAGIGANIYGLARTGVLAATEKFSGKIVDTVAKRISATLGGKNVSQAAAQRAAQGILEKTAKGIGSGAGVITKNIAQGAIEGSLDMAVPAAAEALFGNYGEAAESLLLGSAFGGILGGGVRTAIDAGSAARRGFGAALDSDESFIKSLPVKTLSTYTNIPEDDILYAYRNTKRILEAPSFEKNYDDITQAVNAEKQALDVAEADFERSKYALDNQIKLKANEYQKLEASPALKIEDALSQDIRSAKEILGAESRMADDILAEDLAEVGFSKQQILQQFDDAMVGQKRIGAKQAADLDGLQRIRDDIEREYGDVLSGVELREAKQLIAKEADFDTRDSQFGELYDRVLKNVSRNLSEELKKLSTPYKEAMARMANLAGALDELDDVLRSPVQRLSLAKDIANPAKPSNQQKLRAFERFKQSLSEYDQNFGGEIQAKYDDLLKDYRAAAEFREKKYVAGFDGSGADMNRFAEEYFPEAYTDFQTKKANFEAVKNQFQDVRVFTTGDAENKIRSLMGSKDNVALNRALDALSERQGLGDIKDRIRDRYIADSFEKARTQGSRATNLVGATAGGLGGAAFGALGLGTGGVGTLIALAGGAATGAFLDRYAGKLLKKTLEDNPFANRIRGLIVAEETLGKIAREIDQIPSKLEKLDQAKGAKDRASAARTVNASMSKLIQSLISSERNEERTETDQENQKGAKPVSKAQSQSEAFKVISDRLAELSNPDTMEQAITDLTGDITAGGGPNIAASMAMKLVEGYQYLASEIPKNPVPKSVFAKKDTWQPSDYDREVFFEKLLVVNEPMIVFDALEAGLLTRNHMQALEAVYPDLYARITEKVFSAVTEKEIDLAYEDKIGLSYILGVPLDQSMTAESFAYFQPQTQTTDEGVEVERAQSKGFAPRLNLKTDTTSTTLQRIRERA